MLLPDELDPQLVAVIAAYIYPSCTNEQREEWTADLLRLGDSPAQELYVQLAALKAEILAEAQAREAALREALRDVVDPIEMYRRSVPEGYIWNVDWAVRAAGMVETYKEIARKALALPADTAALDAALAQARKAERERCREAVAVLGWALPGKSCCAETYREALAEIDGLGEA